MLHQFPDAMAVGKGFEAACAAVMPSRFAASAGPCQGEPLYPVCKRSTMHSISDIKRYHNGIMRVHVLALSLVLASASLPGQKTKKAAPPAPVPAVQHNDEAYTAEILKDTTENFS